MRRVPTTSASRRPTELQTLFIIWTLFWSPSLQNIVQNPVFRHSFYGNCLHICTDLLQNGANKKNYTQTHTHFPAHLSLAGDPYLNHSKRFLYSGKAPKTGPIPDPEILIRTRLIGSSGLLRSLALSSSCACGAPFISSKQGALQVPTEYLRRHLPPRVHSSLYYNVI